MLLRLVICALLCGILSVCSDGVTSRPGFSTDVDWSLTRPPPEPESEGTASWRLIAQAELIITAKLIVADDAMMAVAARKKEYIPISFAVQRVLKGSDPGSIVQAMHYGASQFRPRPEAITSLRGADVIVSLVHAADAPRGPYHFAGYTPAALVPRSADLEIALAKEVAAQEELRRRVVARLTAHTPPENGRVASIVARLLESGGAESSKTELLALGLEAAPALIKHMDDRRRLAAPGISLSIPGAFEALTHYAPTTVVDILSIALERLGDESFGGIYNGGSEAARRLTVEAWQTWLGRSLRL